MRLPRRPGVDALEQAGEELSRGPSLLVLDNFEHLVEEGAAAVIVLLQRAESLRCLVTSRQPVGISGEQEFPLLPLPTPDDRGIEGPAELAQCASVKLFVSRAQAARPDFQITRGNAAAVAQLCRRLEGIPLALELAAARSQVFTPTQMLAELERRFDFLVTRRRDAAERHRSLRAALDWSYDLLPPELQRFFARLCVFRGGFTVEAAEIAAGDRERPTLDAPPFSPRTSGSTLESLERLRACSLVTAEEAAEGMRFRLLEMLREYARERLDAGAWAAVAQTHGCYYLRVAEAARPELSGTERRRWLDRLSCDEDNLRAAADWFTQTGQGEAALRLGHALGRFWHERGRHSEALLRLSTALTLPETPAVPAPLPPAPPRLGRSFAELRARALNTAGRLAWTLADYGASRAYFEESLAVCGSRGDRDGVGDSLTGLGGLALSCGEEEMAESLCREALKIHRETGNCFGEATNLVQLGNLARRRGDYATAVALCEKSLTINREHGYPREEAVSLTHLGLIGYERADYPAARRNYEEGLAVCRRVGGERGAGHCSLGLARVAHCQGLAEDARSFAHEALAYYRGSGNRNDAAACLALLAALALRCGEEDEARALVVEARAHLGSRPDNAVTTECGESDQGRYARLPSYLRTLLLDTGDEPGARLIGVTEADG
jgi:predicted ATPase